MSKNADPFSWHRPFWGSVVPHLWWASSSCPLRRWGRQGWGSSCPTPPGLHQTRRTPPGWSPDHNKYFIIRYPQNCTLISLMNYWTGTENRRVPGSLSAAVSFWPLGSRSVIIYTDPDPVPDPDTSVKYQKTNKTPDFYSFCDFLITC